MKLLDSSYYLTLFFGSWEKFAGSLLYCVNEVSSFLLLCRQADLLKKNVSYKKVIKDVLYMAMQDVAYCL